MTSLISHDTAAHALTGSGARARATALESLVLRLTSSVARSVEHRMEQREARTVAAVALGHARAEASERMRVDAAAHTLGLRR